MTTATLDLPVISRRDGTQDTDICRATSHQRFAAWSVFHRDNPQVFELFLRFARQAKAAGRERFGARMIGERIRWHVAIETKSEDGLKINNIFFPYWARLTMLLHPELAGIFERRDSHFDASDADLLAVHSQGAAA